MRKLRVPIGALALVALTGTGVAGVELAVTTSPAAAGKAPVSATCTGFAVATTSSALVSGAPLAGLVSGCAGGKTSPRGVNVFSITSPSGGSGTISWTDKKITTYTFSASPGSFSCPTFLGVAAGGGDIFTFTGVSGNAKINAGGSVNVCFYGAGDGTEYFAGVGGFTI